jgi:hypothetical protein
MVVIFSFAFSFSAYATTRGIVTGNPVNVRSSPYIGDNRLFQVERGQALYIHSLVGDFYRVTVNDYENVYIAHEFVRIYNTHGTINAEFAWVYDHPREEGGEAFSLLAIDRPIAITAVFKDWYAVEHLGRVAFIERANVNVPEFVSLPSKRLGYTIADEVISLAKQYLGTRYLWGGMSPRGFDCSGFMNYIFRPFGVYLNRRSIDMANNGTYVSRKNLMPGDLVFFATMGGNRISHVGMYIGGGDFIHSSSQRTGVMISSLSTAYWNRTYVTARRVLP